MVEAGSTIGNYQVVRKIGQGAMGAVYLAQHPTIGKRVALKVIHFELSSDEEIVSRFFNEARAVTQIGHPNIVEAHDFGQTPSGDSFIVMELLEGIGLGELLHKNGPLEIDRAVRIAIQITDGLQAAHARGIIHRDLKPDNVFLIPRGDDPSFVKILDFGLAKLTGPGAMSHKTRTGAVLGTAHYMAPEGAEDARKVDHRVDIYALGCILFEMITGQVPFPGVGFGEVLVRHVQEPPPMPSRLRADVPSGIEKIILHALAKKAEFRFATMEAFGRALRDPETFERAFWDLQLPTDPTAEKLITEPPAPVHVARGPTSQLAADAKTVNAELPAVDGTEVLTPSQADPSFVRRRARSALGVGALLLGGLAILGLVVKLLLPRQSPTQATMPMPDLQPAARIAPVSVPRVLVPDSALEPPVAPASPAIVRPSRKPGHLRVHKAGKARSDDTMILKPAF